jgi:hypothetical protein
MMSSIDSVLPTPHSFAAAFTAAARVPSASAGVVAHALACKLPSSSGSNNVFVSTALLNVRILKTYRDLLLSAFSTGVLSPLVWTRGVRSFS